MNAQKQVLISIFGILSVIFIGTIGFSLFEHLSLFDALWMTVTTVLTVGYGDAVPQNLSGKIFALTIIPLGIGLVTYGLGAVAALIFEGNFSQTFWRRRMENKIQNLENHIIICGMGRVGSQVMQKLLQEKIPVVVIDRAIDITKNIKPNVLYLEGDATEDKILYQAGIDKAFGLVASLPDDAANVFIVLTARGINPDIQIVARVEKASAEEKLYRAGADKVINPSNIGARRMALSILKPNSVEYVDTIFHSDNEEFSVEEITIQAESKLVNKTLNETKIKETYEVTIVAIKKKDRIISNPDSSVTITAGDLLIVFGSRKQLNKLDEVLTGIRKVIRRF